MPKSAAPYLKQIQKLSQKVFIFYSFQDPCSDSFQDHCIVLLFVYLYASCIQEREIFIWNFLSRPSFKTLVLVSAVKPIQNTDFNHFKTLVLVSFQHNGRQTAHISTTQVQLACWRLAACIWQVERSDHTHTTSIQHQERDLVCKNCRLSQ